MHDTRPTADRVRETIFNVLGQQFVDGERVLDLYAGTGALGLEAISRGAVSAVLVEADRKVAELCTRNAQSLGFADQVEVVQRPVERVVGWLASQQKSFELIFADAPYALAAGAHVIGWAESHRLLTPQGTLVIEHDKRETLPETQGSMQRVDERAFGDTRVSWYRRVLV